jgi:thioredoxin-like negative regulator of GroEL
MANKDYPPKNTIDKESSGNILIELADLKKQEEQELAEIYNIKPTGDTFDDTVHNEDEKGREVKLNLSDPKPESRAEILIRTRREREQQIEQSKLSPEDKEIALLKEQLDLLLQQEKTPEPTKVVTEISETTDPAARISELHAQYKECQDELKNTSAFKLLKVYTLEKRLKAITKEGLELQKILTQRNMRAID